MKNSTLNTRFNKNALISGLLYVGLTIVGMYAFVIAFPQIIIQGDVAATLANVSTSAAQFRFAIFCILLMNVISILLALYLYKLLAPVNKNMARIMLSFLLLGAGISMLNEVNHIAILLISDSASYTVQEAQNLTHLFIEMQHYGSYIAVIFWGLWLFPLALLVYQLDTRISKIIGIMVAIAGLGYVIDSIIVFLAPDLLATTVTDYTFIGEIFLMIWLLVKSKWIEQLVLNKKQTVNLMQA